MATTLPSRAGESTRWTPRATPNGPIAIGLDCKTIVFTAASAPLGTRSASNAVTTTK